MNKLTGTIRGIESSQHMSMVDIDVQGDIFSAIVLETPGTVDYLRQGAQISLLFKETEVSIAKNLSGLISLRNRFGAIVKDLQQDVLLSKIQLDFKGKTVVSIISTRSVQMLGLKLGDAVEWLVKTNEISLFKEQA